jgi:hypothetical protein
MLKKRSHGGFRLGCNQLVAVDVTHTVRTAGGASSERKPLQLHSRGALLPRSRVRPQGTTACRWPGWANTPTWAPDGVGAGRAAPTGARSLLLSVSMLPRSLRNAELSHFLLDRPPNFHFCGLVSCVFLFASPVDFCFFVRYDGIQLGWCICWFFLLERWVTSQYRLPLTNSCSSAVECQPYLLC